MQAHLDAGTVDFISESIFTAIKLNNVDITLLRWKSGLASYRPMLITRIDSPINSIDDLSGRSIAFEDPKSTSAYLIPMLTLLDHGYNVVKKTDIHQPNSDPYVNYLFAAEAYSNSKHNLAIWSSRGLVDVAAISNKDWINRRKFPTHIRDELKIVHQLAPIPRAVTLFRQNMNPIVKSQLVKALINAHNDQNSFEALRAFKKTSQFTRLTEDEIQMIRDIKSQYHSILAPIE